MPLPRRPGCATGLRISWHLLGSLLRAAPGVPSPRKALPLRPTPVLTFGIGRGDEGEIAVIGSVERLQRRRSFGGTRVLHGSARRDSSVGEPREGRTEPPGKPGQQQPAEAEIISSSSSSLLLLLLTEHQAANMRSTFRLGSRKALFDWLLRSSS